MCCYIILIAGGWYLSLMTPLMSPLSASSYKCEAVGHRPAVFPDHHDEDRAHQAHRVHGVFEKVSVRGHWPLPCRGTGGLRTPLIWNASNELTELIPECTCELFQWCFRSLNITDHVNLDASCWKCPQRTSYWRCLKLFIPFIKLLY